MRPACMHACAWEHKSILGVPTAVLEYLSICPGPRDRIFPCQLRGAFSNTKAGDEANTDSEALRSKRLAEPELGAPWSAAAANRQVCLDRGSIPPRAI